MATFERKLITRATRVKKGWKGTPGLSDAKAGDWLVEPDGLMCAHPTVWPDHLFRANFEPMGEEAEGLLNPPRERTLYESEGCRILLQTSLDGVWIRFKDPFGKEGAVNLSVAGGSFLQKTLEDIVDHLGLETPL